MPLCLRSRRKPHPNVHARHLPFPPHLGFEQTTARTMQQRSTARSWPPVCRPTSSRTLQRCTFTSLPSSRPSPRPTSSRSKPSRLQQPSSAQEDRRSSTRPRKRGRSQSFTSRPDDWSPTAREQDGSRRPRRAKDANASQSSGPRSSSRVTAIRCGTSH